MLARVSFLLADQPQTQSQYRSHSHNNSNNLSRSPHLSLVTRVEINVVSLTFQKLRHTFEEPGHHSINVKHYFGGTKSFKIQGAKTTRFSPLSSIYRLWFEMKNAGTSLMQTFLDYKKLLHDFQLVCTVFISSNNGLLFKIFLMAASR